MKTQNDQSFQSVNATGALSVAPESMLIVDLDLSKPLPRIPADVDGLPYPRALVLVRVCGYPLGLVILETDLDAKTLSKIIWARLGRRLNGFLSDNSLGEVTDLPAEGLTINRTPDFVVERERVLHETPMVSVVICTRDRTDIAPSLEALCALEYPRLEILLVDNAPRTDAVRDLVRERFSHRITYLREDRPGLSWARNCGLGAARGEIVAFTDDDAVVDQYWLSELLRGFRTSDNVACVTGLCLPSELETRPQVWFQGCGEETGFGRGFTRRRFGLGLRSSGDPLFPYRASTFGSGLNMAFRTSILRRLGGFEVALGAGSQTKGGEDLAAYFEVLAGGYEIAYEPGAIVWHAHRRNLDGLQQQMYDYGLGFSAYLTHVLIRHPSWLVRFFIRVPIGLLTTSRRFDPNAADYADRPKELASLEMRGLLAGPFAYLLSLWRKRRDTGLRRQWRGSHAPR